MFKMINKVLKNEKGFTLVELMVVVVIIGVLAAIAVPVYNNVTESAERSAVEANLRILDGSIMVYYAEKGAYPTDIDVLNDYIEGEISELGPAGAEYFIDAGETRAKVKGDVGGVNIPESGVSLPIDWDALKNSEGGGGD